MTKAEARTCPPGQTTTPAPNGQSPEKPPVVGRFAPTPGGRLHLGNLYCALLAWLSAKKQGGKCILRIEDLDFARCSFAEPLQWLFEDLAWFGLTFDGGYDPSEYQSAHFDRYQEIYERFLRQGRIYPCECSRADLHAATAPHARDGQPIYDRRCYRKYLAGEPLTSGRSPAWRLIVPDETLAFRDGLCGEYAQNLLQDCSDFVLRRSDGVYAYQLAVVADDAASGVTEVVRGEDLLSSTPRQLYLYRLLGATPPTYYHIPLLTASDGRRLAKREGDSLAVWRKQYSPDRLRGILAHAAGLLPTPDAVSLTELISRFDWNKVRQKKAAAGGFFRISE